MQPAPDVLQLSLRTTDFNMCFSYHGQNEHIYNVGLGRVPVSRPSPLQCLVHEWFETLQHCLAWRGDMRKAPKRRARGIVISTVVSNDQLYACLTTRLTNVPAAYDLNCRQPC